MAYHQYNFCGCFYVSRDPSTYPQKIYLPQVDLSSHTTILSTTSRTTLTQTFQNPSKSENLNQVQYLFPLYDGVGVVGFKCTVAGRVIVGVVREKEQARKEYKQAVDRGETAGLFEQLSDAADCFTTRIGNVPANDKVVVQITYLGELKNDAETDGIRFTIPTAIAPRYGTPSANSGGIPEISFSAADKGGMRILVDIAMEDGATVRGVQSPSHPIAMTMGRTSTMPEDAFDNQHASATLTLGTTTLDKDFVLVVVSKSHDTPRALLETHPTIPNHRTLMATLVPKFNIPPIHPEIVLVADRSGSMGGKIPTLVSALKIFLKSLPVGVKFNICSFGSRYSFLWNRSQKYDEANLSAALKHVDSFDANFGGTEMLPPIKATTELRYKDMPLEVIVVTDGQIWNQAELFQFINQAATKSVRFFSLGIGSGASSSLVEGIANAGDGFAQFVGENEKMEKKVVRMLKGALTPHIKDYTMHVKYEQGDEDYEMVESVTEKSKDVERVPEKPKSKMGRVISLFNNSAKVEDTIENTVGKYDHLPEIETPKLLQAPHKIPPLYPFNRTTVYLLMSEASYQRKPRVIVLRATSEHGPLELEIPVQDVGSGETLHQLASRKAIHELEDGRGWITDAKDKDGALIKTKFEGRWDEIVEREGVRLGVRFQVNSKWCSFVAVEKSPNKPDEDLPNYEMVERVDRGESTDLGGGLFSSSFSSMPQDARQSIAFARTTQTFSSRLAPAPTGGYGGFLGNPGFSAFGQQQQQQQQQQSSSPPRQANESRAGLMSSSLFSSAIQFSTDSSSPASPASAAPHLIAPKHQFSQFSQRVAQAKTSSPISPPMADRRMRGRAASPKRARYSDANDQNLVGYSDGAESKTDEERMHELISLQAFDGSWKWTDMLLGVVNVAGLKVKADLVGFDETVMATLLAVAFLEDKMSAEQGVWEMVVEKATGWLEGRIGREKYELGLGKVKTDLLGLGREK